MSLRPVKAPPRRYRSRLIGLRPWTVGPLDDDLLRPWRSWYGISLFDRDPVRAGDRNMRRRVARHARWGRAFYYFNGSLKRTIPGLHLNARRFGSRA